MNSKLIYTCPCCGYYSFDEKPGSEEICLNCYWQDDFGALIQPMELSISSTLFDSQKNVLNYGACEPRFIEVLKSRRPNNLVKNCKWRPIDFKIDKFDGVLTQLPDDLTVFYYWEDNYWLKQA